METILITGGSGIIGSELIPALLSKGYEVRVLSRTPKSIDGVKVFTWDIEWETIEEGAMDNVDHIIHLAGFTVSKRWTENRKKMMEDSRIKAVEVLKYHLLDHQIKTFISASGVSIYGTQTSEQIFTERDSPALDTEDYLGHLSQDWEKASKQFDNQAERIVLLRTPIVLSRTGGALEKMLNPIKKGIGSALGSGKQYMPWVHIDDLVKAYVLAVEHPELSGAFNIVAPEHVTNAGFIQALAKAVKKKLWGPNVPAILLRLMFGKMAYIVLNGSRVSGKKITTVGFSYEHTSLDESLQNLLAK